MDLPRKLGPYRLLRRLGSGGMAEVFLAQAFGASGFEKHVALKVLLPEHQGDGAYERMLIDEARLGSSLAHPNLVGVHDLGIDQGAYYMRLDWVDGADLGALLVRGRPPREVALAIGEGLAQGLAYLHAASDPQGRPLGLVHRDVSPPNVLLSRSGEVKLADFGIAKATRVARSHASQARKGKLGYMSPEQTRDDPLTPRSDQFSLASTLYEALTGVAAFEGTSPLDALRRVRDAVLPPWDGLDAGLIAWFERAWALRPQDRFSDAQEMSRALANLGASRPADVGEWVRTHVAGIESHRRILPEAP